MSRWSKTLLRRVNLLMLVMVSCCKRLLKVVIAYCDFLGMAPPTAEYIGKTIPVKEKIPAARYRTPVRWDLKMAILRRYGTQRAFTNLVGISDASLTHIVVGRQPGHPHREKIAELLGESVESLFGKEKEEE